MPRQFLLAIAMFMFGTPTASAETLAVVGFNVDSDDASDDVIAAQLANSAGVDIWGLTEVWDKRDWPETLKLGAEAGAGVAYGSILGATGGDERALILYRSDRLELLGHEEITGATASDKEAAPLAARLRLQDGPEFLFVVVRFSEQGARRKKQTAGLAAWADSQTLPVVAIGSFFFDLDKDDPADPDFDRLLATTGWTWVQPDSSVGTWCGDRSRITENVLVGGGATVWAGTATVMYPQGNYCRDSVRSSDHRPLLAKFAFAGDSSLPDATMPERQVRPFLPGGVRVVTESDLEQADEDAPAPVSKSEYDALKRRVEELESLPPTPQAPGPATATMPGAAPAKTPVADQTGAPDRAPASPEVVVEESVDLVTAPVPPPAPAEPDLVSPPDPYEALLKRIEELEAEVQRLRDSESDATR